MNIKAVIFDLDGTLFDSIEDIADANNAMLKSFGFKQHELEKYIGWIGNGALKLVVASLPQAAKNDEASWQTYLSVYEKEYTQNIDVKSKVYEGVKEVLDYLVLKNIPMAINTNKPQKLTDIVVEKYFADWNFIQVVGQSKEVVKKPDPTSALQIAKKMNIEPANILFVGDSMVDIETAKNAGMQCLGVTYGYGNVFTNTVVDGVTIMEKPQQIIEFIND